MDVRHALNVMPRSAQPKNVTARSVNSTLTALSLRRQKWDLVVAYDPFSGSLIRHLSYGKLVYDCVDAYDVQPQYSGVANSRAVRMAETELSQLADVRVATSAALARRRSIDWGAHVDFIEGAHELSQQNLPVRAMNAKGLCRALYVGAFDAYKMDASPILEWLNANGGRTLVMAGRELAGADETIRQLVHHPRVQVEKPVNSEEMALLSARSDFGIISLAKNPYNIYSFPLKTWDYLMNGLPVLAANAPSISGIAGVFPLQADAPHSIPQSEELIHSAEAFHADRRFERILELL